MRLYLCADSSPGEAIFWLMILLALVIVAFMVVGFLRRYFHDTTSPEVKSVFTLGDLRQMLRDGRINQQEFDRLKSQLIGSLKKGPAPSEEK